MRRSRCLGSRSGCFGLEMIGLDLDLFVVRWTAVFLSRAEEQAVMKSRFIRKVSGCVVLSLLFAIATGAQTQSQHPLLDKLAAKVIQKYQGSSCEQLKMQKLDKQPPSEQDQKVVAFLKSDPELRAYFINKVAAPIANKMFVCGMIP